MTEKAATALAKGLVASVCFGIAGYLAVNHSDVWGWFAFFGVMAL